MLLHRLVSASDSVAKTRSRLEKRDLLAGCLIDAPAPELALVVSYLSGTLAQGRIGIGPALLRQASQGEAARRETLSLQQVDATFERVAGISGRGSQQARRAQIGELFARATAEERRFLIRLLLGELRQGALESALIDAIAQAAEVPAAAVQRAVMLVGDLAPVAVAAMTDGRAGLAQFRLELLSPVRPMLAQPADGIGNALDTLGIAALDYKLDGARVQIHRVGRDVRIYSRQLNDVTASLPEVVNAVLDLPAENLLLDGEVLALREDGRPQPFQVTMRRFGRKSGVAELQHTLPISLFLFDLIHSEGEDLIDRPAHERFDRMAATLPASLIVPRLITDDTAAADAFLARAFDQGHEGLVAKSLDSPYAAGSRGSDWLKVKQAHTLDLVILAAEWGSGRRKGWLSNLHLGARDPRTNSFVMLGKTFKGLTDRVLEWQTKRLLQLEIGREDHVVHVEPQLVAEIAVNEIQASPHYPAGLALRFARVKRYRDDKTAAEADTIDSVRALYKSQTHLEAPDL